MYRRIVLFGATGDLTARLLMPAFAQLASEGRLPDDLTILGTSTKDITADAFRAHITSALAEHAAGIPAEARASVVDRLDYRLGDVTDAASVKDLLGPTRGGQLVYLALPSVILERALAALSEAGLGTEDALAVEKPFGTDLASAQRLNGILAQKMPQPTVFRIDHFLTDTLVQRVLALRFMNRLFEPLLNAHHVARVDVSWLESLALEGRAGYYDRAGALKDMLQNHLMVAMSLVAMDEPARIDGASFRGARVEVLRSIPTPTPEQIGYHTVRARYGAGTIGERAVPAYVDEPGVDPSRNTETYAAVRLNLRNNRWDGVPFVLRSGKALAEDRAEIAIHLKPVVAPFEHVVSPNVLRIGLMEPYVRVGTVINGDDLAPLRQELDLMSPPSPRSAYANLILEMLEGHASLFIRGDEAEEAWRIVDPIVAAWRDGVVPLHTYAAGEAPPAL